MKTLEDEAFDELAKRQGAWGGGFPAKRAMAKARIEEDDDIQDYKKPWKKLTKEERAIFEAANPKTQEEWDELFNGIEAKLKDKNT